MWSKPGNPVAIDPSQVVVGLYVWLDIPWADHPFLTSRLMVRTPKEVAVIKASNPAGRLYYYPERSEVVPPPPDAARAAPAAHEREALANEVELRRQAKGRRQASHSGAQSSSVSQQPPAATM